MLFEVLLSTMNRKGFMIYHDMNINSDAVIVNQTNRDYIKHYSINNNNVKYIESEKRGLSKSRNLAIESSNADICIIADDDLIYVDNMEQLVIYEFKKNPEYDIITFQVEGIDKQFKKYYKYERKLNFITSMKVASVEIAFRMDSLKSKSIIFKEDFGAGSKYKMGEENIFLCECLKKGLKMKYVPVKIADLYVGDSSWFQGYDDKYFNDLGAVYAAMSKTFSYFLIIQFAIRKYTLYKNENMFWRSIKNMLKGRIEYLKK